MSPRSKIGQTHFIKRIGITHTLIAQPPLLIDLLNNNELTPLYLRWLSRLSSFFLYYITLLVTARKKILTNGAAHSAFHKSQAKKKKGIRAELNRWLTVWPYRAWLVVLKALSYLQISSSALAIFYLTSGCKDFLADCVKHTHIDTFVCVILYHRRMIE